MFYQVYYDAIKKILDLVTIIQDQDLSNNLILGSMSQQLLIYIDQMHEQAKQFIFKYSPEQQQQGLKVLIGKEQDTELVQQQPFLQKDNQQLQQQFEKGQSQQSHNMAQKQQQQQRQELQLKEIECQDQEIQQKSNRQGKQFTLKQQLQEQKQQQLQQQYQQQQQQQQQQSQQQQQQQQLQQQQQKQQQQQGSSVIFYPIKNPQRQNQKNNGLFNINSQLDELKIKYNILLKLTNGQVKQYPYTNEVTINEQCIICLSDILDLTDQQAIIQLPCNHLFHCHCLNQCINNDSLKCPIDQKIYGTIIGDQPDGTMVHREIKSKCEGYNCETIFIEYFFPSGVKNGQSYTGTHREAYLPNNSEGKEALLLLKRCFNQKLTFIIGTSLTTGQENTVVWNGIHHKTSLSGGPTKFGYPDNTYIKRLKEELSAKGIY